MTKPANAHQRNEWYDQTQRRIAEEQSNHAPGRHPVTMTEDELMRGITDALTLAGWTWMHIIRSDGVTAGGSGFPDVIAYHPQRHLVILWELKGEKTPITPEQASWISNTAGRRISAGIIRPVNYDAALDVVLGRRIPSVGYDLGGNI